MSKFSHLLDKHFASNHTEWRQNGHGDYPYFPCNLCGLYVAFLDVHMQKRHPETWIQCEACPTVLEGPEEFKEHSMAIHDHTDVDDIDLEQKIEYERELAAHKFSTAALKKRDHAKLETKQAKKATCHICGKRLISKKALEAHTMAVHENIKDKACDMCDFVTAYDSGLLRHKQSVHFKKNIFYCDRCSYSCYTRSALITHVRYVHDKIKPHSCEYCEMSFTYKRELVQHKQKIHSVY